jgi:hypothetical protein
MIATIGNRSRPWIFSRGELSRLTAPGNCERPWIADPPNICNAGAIREFSPGLLRNSS